MQVVEKTGAVGADTTVPAVSSQITPEETVRNHHHATSGNYCDVLNICRQGPQGRAQRGEKPPPAKKRGTLPGYEVTWKFKIISNFV